ncbi:MAG: MarC family protein [Neisseria sp.]|nr:MarC family protein [Neisseria sp.]
MELEIAKLILAFMVLINPFGALSLYLDLTRGLAKREKHRVAQMAGLAVFGAIVVFTLGGGLLLKALGISIGSFQIGGGILLFLIAVSMMSGGGNPAKPDVGTQEGKEIVVHAESHNLAAMSVVPLAIPMMIGPGGISTVIIYSSSARTYQDYAFILSAGFVVSLICYLSLVVAAMVIRWLGDTGLAILNRIMGILLAAVAVEIVVAGLRTLFPQLMA